MTLVLQYTAQTTVPVEVEGLIPSAVTEKGLGEIERMEILHGNRKLPLAEMFRALGDAADERIEFQGDLAGVHWIGGGMDRGEIRVAGPAGRHVGSEMTGGQIAVDGDAGEASHNRASRSRNSSTIPLRIIASLRSAMCGSILHPASDRPRSCLSAGWGRN